ncbi:acyl-CoA thioesterase [Pantanalinema sp. GBBB05]|uniref:acyl-CoA thioesterase n=1 Tax=Pantanalinema sp. GBBB05 TaxID=2604139 RepID=UPI001D7CC9CC|nr:acyl-CoA thioesterase [Pantanalinema sp. GBBB05]
MAFVYQRIVRFQDTDAAGVVYFTNILAMCHEAYEASLAASGINLKQFFSPAGVVIPLIHAQADFFQPMFCGDRLNVHLTPLEPHNHEFEVLYTIWNADQPGRLLNQARTRHVCIDPTTRTRTALPTEMIDWLHQWHPEHASEPSL